MIIDSIHLLQVQGTSALKYLEHFGLSFSLVCCRLVVTPESEKAPGKNNISYLQMFM